MVRDSENRQRRRCNCGLAFPENAPSILEGFIDFEREVSVVAARGRDGKVECFEVTENEHRDHILKISRVPAKVTPALAREARLVATRIARAFDYVGVLAVEMFVVREGRRRTVLVNEIAPARTQSATGLSTARRFPSSSNTSGRWQAGCWLLCRAAARRC